NIINKVSSYYEYQSAVPLFNLFKLHGSLNWRFSRKQNEILYDSGLTSTKKTSKIHFEKSELINCFDEKGKFLNLSKIYNAASTTDLSKIQHKIDQFINNYSDLIIVNPEKEKFQETTLKLSYYELLRMYANNLE